MANKEISGSLLRDRIDPEFEKMWDRLYEESIAISKAVETPQEHQQVETIYAAGAITTRQTAAITPVQEALF